VYRARDTKLDREVAIKILPEEFARDEERLARFEREAKILASLNHPNIASIHGFEESDGVAGRASLSLELLARLARRTRRTLDTGGGPWACKTSGTAGDCF